MGRAPLTTVIHYVRCLAGSSEAAGSTDCELIEAFAARRDENAFTALVHRHGPLVWGVCTRLLANTQDAEDAFQAAFLVLARKAAAVAWRSDVTSWLYAVALRTALKTRALAARRRRQEQPIPNVLASPPENVTMELRRILDEELGRLPAKYRRPLILHYLEGKSYSETAGALGWPAGTVSSRLARGRDMLRRRLEPRGLALSAVVLVSALTDAAAATMPAALSERTIQGIVLMAFGQTAEGLISAQAVIVKQGVLRVMFFTKLKIAAALFLSIGLAGTSAYVGSRAAPVSPQEAAASPQDLPPSTAANNSEITRLREENERLRAELRKARELAHLSQPLAVLYQGKPARYWLEQYRDRDPIYRARAITALAGIAEEDHTLIPIVMRALTDKASEVQSAAREGIGHLGTTALPTLSQASHDPDKATRILAVRGLSNMLMGGAPSALLDAVRDPGKEVRREAILALGPFIHQKSARQAVTTALADEDADVRAAAVYQLGRDWTAESLPDLRDAMVRALKDNDVDVRLAAVDVLRRMGHAAKPAISALTAALNDKDQRVRDAAAEALKRASRPPPASKDRP